MAEIFCLCFLEGADGVNYDTKIMVKRPLYAWMNVSAGGVGIEGIIIEQVALTTNF